MMRQNQATAPLAGTRWRQYRPDLFKPAGQGTRKLKPVARLNHTDSLKTTPEERAEAAAARAKVHAARAAARATYERLWSIVMADPSQSCSEVARLHGVKPGRFGKWVSTNKPGWMDLKKSKK